MPENGKDKKEKSKKTTGADSADALILILVLLFVFVFFLAGSSVDYSSRTDGFTENVFVERFILVLKILSAIVTALSLVGLGYVTLRNSVFRPILSQKRMSIEKYDHPAHSCHDEWDRLRIKLQTAGDSDAVSLILEADAIVDNTLKALKIPGETMGDRLKNLESRNFKNLNNFWEAHKMRNQVAHGGTHQASFADAVLVMDRFEKGLRELGVL